MSTPIHKADERAEAHLRLGKDSLPHASQPSAAERLSDAREWLHIAASDIGDERSERIIDACEALADVCESLLARSTSEPLTTAEHIPDHAVAECAPTSSAASPALAARTCSDPQHADVAIGQALIDAYQQLIAEKGDNGPARRVFSLFNSPLSELLMLSHDLDDRGTAERSRVAEVIDLAGKLERLGIELMREVADAR